MKRHSVSSRARRGMVGGRTAGRAHQGIRPDWRHCRVAIEDFCLALAAEQRKFDMYCTTRKRKSRASASIALQTLLERSTRLHSSTTACLAAIDDDDDDTALVTSSALDPFRTSLEASMTDAFSLVRACLRAKRSCRSSSLRFLTPSAVRGGFW